MIETTFGEVKMKGYFWYMGEQYQKMSDDIAKSVGHKFLDSFDPKDIVMIVKEG